jgi:hypothetical protein
MTQVVVSMLEQFLASILLNVATFFCILELNVFGQNIILSQQVVLYYNLAFRSFKTNQVIFESVELIELCLHLIVHRQLVLVDATP